MSTCLPKSQGEGFEGPERRACDRLFPEGISPITLVSGRRSLTCRIENISLSGVQLAFEGAPPILGEIALDHEAAGRIAGQAVWQNESRIGVQLCEPGTELERALQCLNMINGSR